MLTTSYKIAYNNIKGEIVMTIQEGMIKRIQQYLKKMNRTQTDLANYIGVSKQTMSKMLSGARMINANEIKQIADFFEVKIDELFNSEKKNEQTSGAYALMGKVESEQAKEAIEIVDKIADLIIFHKNARNNFEEMNTPWDD